MYVIIIFIDCIKKHFTVRFQTNLQKVKNFILSLDKNGGCQYD